MADATKPLCLHPLPDGRRCCECDTCQGTAAAYKDIADALWEIDKVAVKSGDYEAAFREVKALAWGLRRALEVSNLSSATSRGPIHDPLAK